MEVPLFFGDTQITLQHSVVEVEKLKKTLHLSSRFNTIPACDGQKDGHTMTAYTALA